MLVAVAAAVFSAVAAAVDNYIAWKCLREGVAATVLVAVTAVVATEVNSCLRSSG